MLHFSSQKIAENTDNMFEILVWSTGSYTNTGTTGIFLYLQKTYLAFNIFIVKNIFSYQYVKN